MAIRCGHCQKQHDTVREVKDCAMAPTPPDRSNPATERQRNYANGLLREREPYGVVEDIELTNSLDAAHEYINGMDFDTISEFIGAMIKQPKRQQEGKTLKVMVGEGMYKKGDCVYRVQRAVHGSGHLYAKRLGDNGFELAPGMLSALLPEDKMSLEEAKEYGALYGVCCVCGRTLTYARSIEAGIGPICAGKDFWS